MSTRNNNQSRSALPVLRTVVKNQNEAKQKSGRVKIRACVLIFVHLVIFAHIAHYLLAEKTLSPLEPSEAMYALELGHLNAGTIFFGLAIVSTVVFGRFFCGWGCHIVAVQDLCSYVLRRIGIRPKPLRSRMLAMIPFAIAFYMFFWPTLQRLWAGERHPGFSNHLLTETFWQTFPGPVFSVLTVVICGGLTVYLLGNKGFCTYGCPYGAFFSVADRLAFGRIQVSDACLHCGQCTAACTSNVMVHREVKEFGMVVDPGCMKCMDCVSACPNDALYFGFTTRSFPNQSDDPKKNSGKPHRNKKRYDFSLAEEILGFCVAFISMFAMRGLYDGPPLLMAVAIGVITGFMAIQFLRVFRKNDLRIQNFRIKRNGRMTRTGQWAVVILSVWFLFNLHSCFVQYHRYRGREHLNRITATWPEMLAGGSLQESFTPEDRTNIYVAIKSFQITDKIGIADVLEVKLGLAFAHMMHGDSESAERYLRRACQLTSESEAIREMLMEFLASQNRQNEASNLL